MTMTTAVDCNALLARIAELGNAITSISKGGVRSVRDSDGSEIQYSTANVRYLQDERNRLTALYNTCCGARGSTAPFGAIFP